MPQKKEKIKEIREKNDVLIGRMVENLLDYAISREAESIVLEPVKDGISVSFNIDGNFSEMFNLAKKSGEELILGIKKLAGFSGEKDNLPQLGKFKKIFLGYEIVFSVSVVLASEGEKIIVEICNEKSKLFHLKQLGFQRSVFEIVKNNLEKYRGGIIVLGDFNSGRTTTLYGLLDFLNNPELNILTVESGVNCDIPLINQIMLNGKKGFDYSFALSAALRQDPNIVMIDEISDRAVMEAFLNLIERGHLVLAGAYSRNIFNYFNFLRDLGVSLPLFADNVNIIINQRLVKKNCPNCVSKFKASKEEIKKLKNFFDFNDLMARAGKNQAGFNFRRGYGEMFFCRSRGCEKCGHKGFSGHIGVFEVLEMTDNVKRLIREGHLSKLKNEIKTQGGFSLAEDALLKAANGIISLNEAFDLLPNI